MSIFNYLENYFMKKIVFVLLMLAIVFATGNVSLHAEGTYSIIKLDGCVFLKRERNVIVACIESYGEPVVGCGIKV